jgi:hypothetical protein
MSANTTSLASITPFFKLPIEICLGIYDYLLVQLDGSHRTLCACQSCHHYHAYENTIYPYILRTNKIIYDEAIKFLYSKNTFELVCDDPLKTCHGICGLPLPSYHSSKPELQTCDDLYAVMNYQTRSYVKTVSLKKLLDTYEDAGHFGTLWSFAEPTLLRAYQNLERVTLNLRYITDCGCLNVHVDLAPQISLSEEKRAQDDHAYPQNSLPDSVGDINYSRRDLEAIPCAMKLFFRRRSDLETSTFGVKAVRYVVPQELEII